MIAEYTRLLQEESERVCGTALPLELVLAILLRWGGMTSPTAMVMHDDPGLKRMLEEVDGMDTWCHGCYCRCVREPRRAASAGYDSDARRECVQALAHTDGVVGGRVPRVTAHLCCRRPQTVLNRVDGDVFGWDSQACGTVMVYRRLRRAIYSPGVLGKADWMFDSVLQDGRLRGGLVRDLQALATVERYDGGWSWGKREDVESRLKKGWRRLIEELQGQEVTSEFWSPAEAWGLYLRADRGEVV